MTGDDWVALARLLADKRNISGLARHQLAKKARVSLETIRNAETGRAKPSRPTLIRLCKVPELDLQWSELPGDLPPPPEFNRGPLEGGVRSPLPCPTCGANSLRPVMRSGQKIPYRMFESLRIAGEIPMFACTQCRAEFLDVAKSGEIRQLAAVAFNSRLTRIARAAISDLQKHVSQRRLERLLGLSTGCLSKLLTGRGTPRPPLVAHLASLAKEPAQRLGELRALWSGTEAPPRRKRPSRDPQTNPREEA